MICNNLIIKTMGFDEEVLVALERISAEVEMLPDLSDTDIIKECNRISGELNQIIELLK